MMENNKKQGQEEFEKILKQCKEEVAKEWPEIKDITNSHLFVEVIGKFVSQYEKEIKGLDPEDYENYKAKVEKIFSAVNFFEDQVVETILNRFQPGAKQEELLKDIPFFLSEETVSLWTVNARKGFDGKNEEQDETQDKKPKETPLESFKERLKKYIKKDLNNLLTSEGGNVYTRNYSSNVVLEYKKFLKWKETEPTAQSFNTLKQNIKMGKAEVDRRDVLNKTVFWQKKLQSKQEEMNSWCSWIRWTAALLFIVGAYYSYAESKDYKKVENWLKEIDVYRNKADTLFWDTTSGKVEKVDKLKKDVERVENELPSKFKM
jgi:hypothetical protein